MKKNEDLNCFCRSGKIKKWLLLMKLITFFFFLGIFQVSASVYGQRGTVTLNLNELTMEDIFTAINRQLKYDIFYRDRKSVV